MPGDVSSSKNKENKKPGPTIDATQLTRRGERSDQGSSSGNNRSGDLKDQLTAKHQEVLALQRQAQEKLKRQWKEFEELQKEREVFAQMPSEDQYFLEPTIRSLLSEVKEPKTPPSSTPE